MEPAPRKPREMTYRVGWKKGRIQPADAAKQACSDDARALPDTASEPLFPSSSPWLSWIWASPRSLSAALLPASVMLLPVGVAGLFLWLVCEFIRLS